jgi:PIN domain nuclease of toxin-antitoxin system
MKTKNIIFFILSIALTGCYSFTGGTIPEYLKTLQIQSVSDYSNFGNPEYKIDLETAITNNFIKDNSFELSENTADARLSVSIASIIETTNAVNQGELESEKKITLTCSVEYYDNVKKKQIWKKNFSSYGLFDVNQAFTARNETIQIVINQIAEDILLSVVSGW